MIPPSKGVASHETTECLLTAADLSASLDWHVLFGSDAPVEIEVGSGTGLFLVTAGAERPETNFLGIEVSRKYANLSAGRVAKRGIDNVRVLVADARDVFSHQVPTCSVQAVHVYFPDPWWKRRHKKRRVLNEVFLRDVQQVLVPGGRLHVWTDVEEYFKTTRELVRRYTDLCPQSSSPQREPEHDMDYQTNFERKMRRRGRPIFRALYSKG